MLTPFFPAYPTQLSESEKRDIARLFHNHDNLGKHPVSRSHTRVTSDELHAKYGLKVKERNNESGILARIGGLLRTLGGVFEIVVGVAAKSPIRLLDGLDNAIAGIVTVLTGEWQQGITGKALKEGFVRIGADPGTSELVAEMIHGSLSSALVATGRRMIDVYALPPRTPLNRALIRHIESPSFQRLVRDIATIDCNDLAENLWRAAGRRGSIVEITPAVGREIRVAERSGTVAYRYHQVYVENNLVYDPRLSTAPHAMEEYLDRLRRLNPRGIQVRTVTSGN